MGLADYIKLGSLGFKPSEIKEFTKNQNITMSEIISLAESGYSAADINELISLNGAGESDTAGTQGADDRLGLNDPPEIDGARASADYKEQLEAAQKEAAQKEKEAEELKAKLLAAQQLNASRNLGGEPAKTNREQVQEAFRGLY